jgi:RNA polymerase sigma-70 factor (ECF subfamily)
MSAPTLDTTAPTAPDAGADLDVFLTERTRLLRIAYRVTRDLADAEDVVQETWLRWQRTDARTITNPAAFLTTTATRLGINVIQSARHRHETGTEPPPSALVELGTSPALLAEHADAVGGALALLMARLTPSALGAFLLRKAFDYGYGEIADLLGTSVPNVRQLVHRARPCLQGGRDRAVDPWAHSHLVAAFLTAARTGDLADLEGLLRGSRELEPQTASERLAPAWDEHRALAA